MTLYALYGPHTKDLLTWHARPIVHDNRTEMQWLFPTSRVVAVTEADLAKRSPLRPLPLREHPELSHMTWPLQREEFR